MEKNELKYTPDDLLGKEFEYPYKNFKKVTVFVDRVNGCCPISVEGDKYVFDLMLYLDKCEISNDLPGFFEGTEGPQICTIAMEAFYRYVKPMCFGVSAVDLGIAKSGEDGFVMCAAWGPPTCEAAVIFRLHPEPVEKGWIDRYYEYLAKAGHVSVPTFYFDKFASKETKDARKKKLEEWKKAGSPKFWSGWENLSCQPYRKK